MKRAAALPQILPRMFRAPAPGYNDPSPCLQKVKCRTLSNSGERSLGRLKSRSLRCLPPPSSSFEQQPAPPRALGELLRALLTPSPFPFVLSELGWMTMTIVDLHAWSAVSDRTPSAPFGLRQRQSTSRAPLSHRPSLGLDTYGLCRKSWVAPAASTTATAPSPMAIYIALRLHPLRDTSCSPPVDLHRPAASTHRRPPRPAPTFKPAQLGAPSPARLWRIPPLSPGRRPGPPRCLPLITRNLVNLAFNWILIYGHFGFPAMGVRGSALSTVLARHLHGRCARLRCLVA